MMTRSQASILIVEDHKDSREALARLLRSHGYEVTTASTAHQARVIAADTEFGLVICDLCLPDQPGHELFAELRSSRGPRGIRGIAVTGMSLGDAAKDIKAAGFDAYLLKPLSGPALIATIERVLALQTVD